MQDLQDLIFRFRQSPGASSSSTGAAVTSSPTSAGVASMPSGASSTPADRGGAAPSESTCSSPAPWILEMLPLASLSSKIYSIFRALRDVAHERNLKRKAPTRWFWAQVHLKNSSRDLKLQPLLPRTRLED